MVAGASSLNVNVKTKKKMSKPFDEGLYNADDDAKYDIIGWLQQCGYTAWVNPDKYGIDVLASKGEDNYSFEVEVKHNWKGAVFPFNEVHFSARKLKFVSPSSFFTMLNNERTHVLLTTGEAVGYSPVVEKKTKYTVAEKFVAVNLRNCVVTNLPAKLI